ncbi:MAG TPA: type III pantothenate kinase [Gemmatimonadales bacterium]|jgi:type III pantothenate kinase
MLLVIDVGNTEATAGLFDQSELLARWRLTSGTDRTPDEWSVALESLIVRAGHSPAEIRASCVASVVPQVTLPLIEALRESIHPQVGIVEPRAALPLTLDVDEPMAVGADRIALALGSLERYPGDSIVVAFGTATTFNCITADRRFIGGSIMPGVRTSADQLIRKAARLGATELVAPDRAIGRSTEANIRAGVMFGAADAVDGMIARIRAEWPGKVPPQVIATGGLATLIAPLSRSIGRVDADLTLHGLRVAARAMHLLA